jgi:hypothetical protein
MTRTTISFTRDGMKLIQAAGTGKAGSPMDA